MTSVFLIPREDTDFIKKTLVEQNGNEWCYLVVVDEHGTNSGDYGPPGVPMELNKRFIGADKFKERVKQNVVSAVSSMRVFDTFEEAEDWGAIACSRLDTERPWNIGSFFWKVFALPKGR